MLTFHIQKNAFYSELPEFNIKQIPSESLYYLRMGTADFISKYFGNSGEVLIKLVDSFESEAMKTLPF